MRSKAKGVHGVGKPFVSVEAVVEHGGWAEAAGVCTRQQARVLGVFFWVIWAVFCWVLLFWILGLGIMDIGL
ncbi:hypothetical protein V6Z11_A02G077700 [Gossypium hirsutum]